MEKTAISRGFERKRDFVHNNNNNDDGLRPHNKVMDDVATCSAPGCLEPGTSKCSSCKITPYCSVACQTIDWVHHKEECQGRLRKLGEAHCQKAKGFNRERNWTQSLHFSELALTMLKKLKARPLEVILIIDNAMGIKYNALNFIDRKKEALECAKERYSLWAAGYMRHHGMLFAAFPLIDGLINNEDYEQAHLIANTAYEMIINDTDIIIPDGLRQDFLAQGSKLLGFATFRLAVSGGIPSGEKQKAGEEAIALIRKGLEIHTQLHGTESDEVAGDLSSLADVLAFFNGVDDDEILRLYEQSNDITARVEGRLSFNMAIGENNLAIAYEKRAATAIAAINLERCEANLELSLTHYRESVRIYRAINLVDKADEAAQRVAKVEGSLRQIRMARG